MREKKTPAQLKFQARQALRGNYGICVGMLLLIGAIFLALYIAILFPIVIGMVFSGGMNSIGPFVAFFGGFFLLIIIIVIGAYMMMLGYVRLCYNICAGRERKIGDLFFAFTHHIWKFLGLTLFFILIPQVLNIPIYIVQMGSQVSHQSPAFMIAFSTFMGILEMILVFFLFLNYSMAPVILVEDPERGLLEALRESRHIMRGNKGRLFWLSLTFFGMFLLSYCSLGIGFLWVLPYMVCTNIQFYFDITEVREAGPEAESSYFTS
ncbi:DUF975 family protein [Lachnospiraceae bacterium 62-35]